MACCFWIETHNFRATSGLEERVGFYLRCDSCGPRWLARPEDDHWFEQYPVFCGFFFLFLLPTSTLKDTSHHGKKRHRRQSLKNKRKWKLVSPRTSADCEVSFFGWGCDDDLFERREYYLGCRMKTPQTPFFSVNYPSELRQLGRFHITRPVQGYELIAQI